MKNRNFRLSGSRTKLPKMQHDQFFDDFKRSKNGEAKPKVHLRYGRLSDIQNKGTLISTIIEEHFLKFGYLMTYDNYINEVAIRNALNRNKVDKFYKISELREILIKVIFEFLSFDWV